MANIKITLHEEDVKKLNDVCNSFGNKPGEVINVLHAAQGIFGYLPAEVQEIIAANLHIPVAKVYGIVSFYSFFTMKPKGKHPISVCLGTACYVRGSEKILEELKKQLNIEVGGTTADGKFSLSCLRCVGACGLAPVVVVDDDVHKTVQIDDLPGILDQYRGE